MERFPGQHDDYRYNRLTLWFKDKRLENAFRAAHTKKTLIQVRTALVIAASMYSLFAVLDVLMLPNDTSHALVVRFGFAVPAFVIGFFLSFSTVVRKKLQVMVATIIFVAGLGIVFITLIYDETMSDLYLAGTLLPLFWAFLFSGLRIVAATIVTASLVAAYEVMILFFSNYSTSAFISYNFYLFSCTLIGMLGGYNIERHYRLDYINNRIINSKRRENEKLLLNILPQAIADELKRKPGTIANRFDKITILFADIVDFTLMSSRRSAVEIVEILNEVFSLFDNITERYGLEKIKTIGDSYMVAGGLKHTNHDAVVDVAEFALCIQDELQKYNERTQSNIKLRIGIHTGPAVAGVIGVKKFIYDIWGDSVNIASRMESTGLPGEIQVSDATYQLLKNSFIFRDRGMIAIKGKGDMRAYILLGKPVETHSIAASA